MRTSKISRHTKETQIDLELSVDGSGQSKISTTIRFLDHMLELFTKHGAFNLTIQAKGDTDVDQHHLVEDIGIALGQAFKEALGDKKGINRAGYFVMPMDESLAITAIDISGRPFLKFDVPFREPKIGDLSSELVQDFFEGFSNNLACNLHLNLPYGRTDHHRCEAVFKSFARALRMACSFDKNMLDQIPSTKGLI
jgi:imidazoleglycerol-phosphate dehydratase